MSSIIEKGKNITNAVMVLKETYKSINLLLDELDRVSKRSGYMSITPRFLRKRSDANFNGWLTSDFIKLYQWEDDPELPHLKSMKDGLIYGVEVDLDSEDYPTIGLNIYNFDLSNWTTHPSVSDYNLYWDPFRDDVHFNINTDEKELFYSSETKEKYISNYSYLKRSVSKVIPLLSISSSEDIKEKIFEGFKDVHFPN
ncbi:hypothetical protein NOM01_14380 [Sporolactobacillus sp. STSJ-5]|uniref:hypothetical protein n=1 Tax=Sporolactobacillus sp. STSJ-5 TaxID=2965076 RepID=UPI002104258F|nr:hypothetical protein [Sporolactobacillus sp. STSJ-5]MCQ2011172.1 hypothetical protein [Sporolactobacillus sp. STSJ-5]